LTITPTSILNYQFTIIMNTILKNVLAVFAGALIGGVVNMGLIMISGSIIPPPEGADLTTPEGLNAAMPLMEAKHFIFPFLAHALGTLVGAFIASRIGATRKMGLALIVGVLFLVGGISAVFLIPAPIWFILLDLIMAYIPMAWLGGKLGSGGKPSTTLAA
jgi:hypothetical protein